MLTNGLTELLLTQCHEQIVREYSGVEVYHIPDLAAYLKIGKVAKNSNLRWERDALEWLAGQFPVPVVLDFELADGIESILISAIDGIPASDYVSSAAATLEAVEDFVKTAAQAMRQLHGIEDVNCPLDQRLDAKFSKACENIENGFVDESDFDSERMGKRAEQIYAELCAERPDDEDLVFTHGDLCLPNIIVRHGGAIAGFIDFDRAGVADRYQDIALFLRSVSFNSGVAIDFEKTFCEAYGIAELNRPKLDFYRKMDELF